jgi:hypothetical protein
LFKNLLHKNPHDFGLFAGSNATEKPRSSWIRWSGSAALRRTSRIRDAIARDSMVHTATAAEPDLFPIWRLEMAIEKKTFLLNRKQKKELARQLQSKNPGL